MRHNKSGRKLNRTSSHRRALFRNMARALLTYEQIRTTEAKAKELRGVVERLVTLAVKNDLHARRLAYRELGSHQLVQKLFDEIGPRYSEGGGGYTRIVKLSQARRGDAAPMVIIELTRRAAEAADGKKEAKKDEAKPKKAASKKTADKAEAKDAAKDEAPKKAAPKKAAPKKAAAKKAAPKKAAPKKAAAKKAAPKKKAEKE